MKQNKNELDVDFIGRAAPLTKEEEKAISAFIKASKIKRRKQTSHREVITNTSLSQTKH